jgi:rhomboid protease GluP
MPPNTYQYYGYSFFCGIFFIKTNNRHFMLKTKSRYPFTNCLLLGIVLSFIIHKTTGAAAVDFGASYQTVFVQQQYWRLLTAAFFHTGYLHLIFNLVNIYNFGSLLEDKLHSGFVTIIFFIGIMASTGVSILCNHTLTTVGASGGIFALVGLFLLMLLYDFYKLDTNENQLYNSITIMLSTSIFISIYFKDVNHVAHAVGFVVGIAAFIFLWKQIKRVNKHEQNKQDNA